MKLILPKRYVHVDPSEAIIFLAGPIGGAPLWQDKAIEIINSINPELWIASPSRHLREEYLEKAMSGVERPGTRQLEWETHYLTRAGRESLNFSGQHIEERKNGSIMFWLPGQIEAKKTNPKTGFPEPYGRDTRGEVARYGYAAIKENPKYPVVVGYEDNFDGIDVITRQFQNYIPSFEFHKTLEATCQAAVRKALNFS